MQRALYLTPKAEFGHSSKCITTMPTNAGFTQRHARWSIEVHGHEIEHYYSDDLNARFVDWHAIFTTRYFQAAYYNNPLFDVTISDDGQSITQDSVGSDGIKSKVVYQREN